MRSDLDAITKIWRDVARLRGLVTPGLTLWNDARSVLGV
jgi:hypothetical protein